jgi:DICT domain-containing protein
VVGPIDPEVTPFGCLPPGTILRRSTKRLLVQLSIELEREARRLGETCVVGATFQHRRHFTSDTARRYAELARETAFLCALGEGLATEPAVGVRGANLSPGDPLCDEWDVTVLSPHFSAALLARDLRSGGLEDEREFEFALTYRRETVVAATQTLLSRVAART